VWNSAWYSTSHNFEPLVFENAARYPNAETNYLCRNYRTMSSLSFVKLGNSTHPWRTVFQSRPTPKIARRKRAKLSVTQPWIIRFCSNFVQSLNTWHPKCCKSSRLRGQTSRSHREITCAKIRKIIHNLIADCSISLKFRADFDHVTLDVPRTFKVNGSKVKVTAWQNVSA